MTSRQDKTPTDQQLPVKSKRYAARSLQLGALIMLLSVAFGAFGAHSLEAVFSAKQLDVWQKAVNYMVVHGLAILVVSYLFWLAAEKSQQWLTIVWVFFFGVLLFSGSLLLWALTGVYWLVFLTPIGGSLFLVGWGLLIWHARSLKSL